LASTLSLPAAPPALFALVYFSDRVLCFFLRLASDWDPPIYASLIADILGYAATPSFSTEGYSYSFILLLFCFQTPLTRDKEKA
jgi:hypothetical protein